MGSKHNFQYCCALSVILAIASASYFLNGYLGEYSGRVSTYCLSVSLIIALLAVFPRSGNKKTSTKNIVKKSLWLIILAIGTPVLSILTDQIRQGDYLFITILALANTANLVMIAITAKRLYRPWDLIRPTWQVRGKKRNNNKFFSRTLTLIFWLPYDCKIKKLIYFEWKFDFYIALAVTCVKTEPT